MTVPDIRVPGPGAGAKLSEKVRQQIAELRLNRILVPLDGTSSAEHALPFAAMIARRLDSEVMLFHSLQPMHPVRVGRPGHVPYPDAQHDRGTHLATSYLEEVAARLRPHGVSARWSVATGEASHVIATRAVAGGFGMVVVAGHPKPRVVRRIQPSIIDGLWRRTATPLFLMNRTRFTLTGLPPKDPEVIFVPYTGGKTSRSSLPLAALLAQAFDSRLVLLLEYEEGKAEDKSKWLHAPMEDIESTADELSRTGCRTEIEHIAGGEIAVARRQLQERGSWVIAASHMRSGLARLVRGSRGDNYLRQCRGPLIVVPHPDIVHKRKRRAHRDAVVLAEPNI